MRQIYYLASILLALIPSTCAQLNTLAVGLGKKYFGTATDNPELSDAPYVAQLENTADFHQLTPVRISLLLGIRTRFIWYSRPIV